MQYIKLAVSVVLTVLMVNILYGAAASQAQTAYAGMTTGAAQSLMGITGYILLVGFASAAAGLIAWINQDPLDNDDWV